MPEKWVTVRSSRDQYTLIDKEFDVVADALKKQYNTQDDKAEDEFIFTGEYVDPFSDDESDDEEPEGVSQVVDDLDGDNRRLPPVRFTPVDNLDEGDEAAFNDFSLNRLFGSSSPSPSA